MPSVNTWALWSNMITKTYDGPRLLYCDEIINDSSYLLIPTPPLENSLCLIQEFKFRQRFSGPVFLSDNNRQNVSLGRQWWTSSRTGNDNHLRSDRDMANLDPLGHHEGCRFSTMPTPIWIHHYQTSRPVMDRPPEFGEARNSRGSLKMLGVEMFNNGEE